MRGVVMYGPGDVRVEEREDPKIVEPTDAIIRLVGDFVVGSFWASDNTCETCKAGYQAYCVHRVLMGTIGTQSELARIPLATPVSRRSRS